MRTETVTKQYFTFEELNDSQKEKAIDQNRYFNTEHLEWWNCVYEDAKAVGSMLGFNISQIYFRGFWSQGDGACFECDVSYSPQILKQVKEYAPNDAELHAIAEELQSIHKMSFYSLTGSTKHSGHYYHERSMSIDYDCERGNVDCERLRDCIADFASWIYSKLESEHDYLTSDECVAESLVANEIEFELSEVE